MTASKNLMALSACSRRNILKSLAFSLVAPLFSPLLPAAAKAAAPSRASKKALVVYYSRSGNTRQVAAHIQSIIPADAVEIQTVTPYPAEYRATTEQAKQELAAGYRPPLSTKIDNLSDYDVIIIGSPNWWGTMAVPMFTFLDSYDLSGKTLALYMTHGGSGLGHSLSDLKRLCPNSTILEGLAIRGGSVGSAQKEVEGWLRKTGLAG